MKLAIPVLVVTLCAWPLAVFAQMTKETPKDPHAQQGPPVDPAMFQPLPDLPGVTSWKTLSQVQAVKQKDKFVPQFDKSIQALDKKEIKIQGFMMPLETGERQKHFILTALPPSCGFCMPGGPEAIVEVRTKQPIKYTVDPVVLSGKLSVLRDDPTGIYYRLIDAAPTKAGR